MNTTAYTYLAFFITSCAVRALPEPIPGSHPVYRWFFIFIHLVLANLDKVNSALKQPALVLSPSDSVNPPK